MSKQSDWRDLVDARCQSTDHLVELSREVVALSRLIGLEATRRAQTAAVAEARVATRHLRVWALVEVDAWAEHLVEPGEWELVHDLHGGKVSQHKVQHSAPGGHLHNHILHMNLRAFVVQ